MSDDLVRIAAGGSRLLFYCCGCLDLHSIVIDGSRGWRWNQSLESPTVTPSVLSDWTNRTTNEHRICHLFIENGHLRVLGDCTHEFKDATVKMDPVSKFLEGELP